jgi:hypothetical protein
MSLAAHLSENCDALQARVRELEAQLAAARSASPYLMQGAQDVFAERQRQIAVEGFTPAHDDRHTAGEMAGAAACYALTAVTHWAAMAAVRTFWPWDWIWWKPKGPRGNLVKAGALILAEIERIDREQAKPAPSFPDDVGSGP